MDTTIQAFQSFLDSAHSVYHAADGLIAELKTAGYTRLEESAHWVLTPGGKYYLTRGGSALIAFRIPREQPRGFMISAGHTDRPTFKVKENGELTGSYTRLATEKYGGMLIAPWLDRPLSIAGRALVDTRDGVESRLVDIDKDLLLIPNVAIHMNRKANEGYAWNPAVDTLPLLGGKGAAGKLNTLLEQAAGGKVLGHDLYLYVRQKSTVWGVDEEYISAAALDDLGCAWCCAGGFLTSGESKAIPVLCLFDGEEIGSSTPQGAASGLLEDVLTRISDAMDWELSQLLCRSMMVSADNGHALHPNHPEYSDANNAPLLGEGVVLKFNAAQRYATDGVSAALFRKICQKAEVPVQTYYNRADIPGGSTLGNISLSHVSIPTADIGLPQLAMHSCYETVAVRDVQYLTEAMKTYYESALDCPGDGTYQLL